MSKAQYRIGRSAFFVFILIIAVRLTNGNVLVDDFENGISLIYECKATDSSSAIVSCDSLNPLSGKKSARFNFVNSGSSQVPWFLFQFLVNKSLKNVTGVHLKFHCTAPSDIQINLGSSYTPWMNAVKGLNYSWWIRNTDDAINEIDLPISAITLNPVPDPNLPSSGQTPTVDEILNYVSTLCIQVFPQGATGSLLVDDIYFTGTDTLLPGVPPKITFPWNDFETVCNTEYPDSIYGSYCFSNASSSISIKGIKATNDNQLTGKRCAVINSNIVDDPGKEFSGYAGCGLPLRSDWKATDLTNLKRIEMAYKNETTASIQIRLDIMSDCYKKELIDSGVVYGWNKMLTDYYIPCLAAEFVTNSLSIPSWATTHPRLVALLPPIDSVLAKAYAIQINVLSYGKQSLKLDYFAFVGIDSLNTVERMTSSVELLPVENTIRTDSITLFWKQGTNDANQYIISFFDSTAGTKIIDTISDTAFHVAGLINKHVYKYYVQPINSYGYGAASSTARFVTSFGQTNLVAASKKYPTRFVVHGLSLHFYLPNPAKVQIEAFTLNGKALFPRIDRMYEPGENVLANIFPGTSAVILKIKSNEYSIIKIVPPFSMKQ